MGDRVRIGELLAAIGTIGLALTVGLLDWFDGSLTASGAGASSIPEQSVGLDAGTLGWFALLILAATFIAGLVYLLRVLTATSPERPMLQAPIAYAFSGFAFLVLLVRLFVFQPGTSIDEVSGDYTLTAAQLTQVTPDVSLAIGAWLGLASVFLLVIGTWYSMADERTGSAAAKRHTADLLKDVPVRPVPHVPAPAESEATVVADDAIGTDPANPSSRPASGGPA